MTNSVVDLAVVDLVEAEPVEEKAIDVVAVHYLVEREERFVLVILATRTDAHETAVLLGSTARGHVAPLGMLGGDAAGDFGKVHTRQEVDAARVRRGDGVTQEVAAWALRE